MLPNFLIVGAQKAGTTALHYYLDEHPDIFMSPKKEVHFFDLDENYARGLKWYEKHFRKHHKEHAVGESSPLYMYLEKVPRRIAKTLPEVKLIFVLRDPVTRAYSHYWHAVRRGVEYLTFEESLKVEEERIRKSFYYRREFSYMDRGKYLIQIKRFLKFFSRKQMIFIISEELRRHQERILTQIYRFLDVDPTFHGTRLHKPWHTGTVPRLWALQKLIHSHPLRRIPYIAALVEKVNLKDHYPPMNPKTKEWLASVFQPHNIALARFLNKDLSLWTGWNS